ncbi:hypothetical protein GCM10020331_087130 [Ectobacillus funiculus]
MGLGLFLWIIQDAPKLDETLLKDPLSSKSYASDGKNNHYRGRYRKKRDDISIDQIPNVLKDAVIATEDSRFYKHHGIDVKRTLVAIFLKLSLLDL